MSRVYKQQFTVTILSKTRQNTFFNQWLTYRCITSHRNDFIKLLHLISIFQSGRANIHHHHHYHHHHQFLLHSSINKTLDLAYWLAQTCQLHSLCQLHFSILKVLFYLKEPHCLNQSLTCNYSCNSLICISTCTYVGLRFIILAVWYFVLSLSNSCG